MVALPWMDWASEPSENYVTVPVFLILFLAATIGGPKLVSLGRRLRAPSAERLMEADRRPPILLLRPFYRDGEQVPYRPGTDSEDLFTDLGEALSIEPKIVGALRSHGPVIAIGRPGEMVPPHGAARLYVPDGEWQAKMLELAERAQLLVVLLGFTPSIAWEIDQVCSARLLPKSVFVVPPQLAGPMEWSGWRHLRERFPNLPEQHDGLIAFRIESPTATWALRRSDEKKEWEDEIVWLDKILPNPKGIYIPKPAPDPMLSRAPIEPDALQDGAETTDDEGRP